MTALPLQDIKKVVPLKRETTPNPNNSIQHYAAIHHKKYIEQPNSNEMGIITNHFKRVGHSQRHHTQDLLKALSSGHCVLLSNFEIDDKNSIRFISSSAFAIDVDDDYQQTNPLEVLQDLKEICTGLFYTFSHGKKGNRYRLFFQLDQSITDPDEFKVLIEYMIDYLKEKGLPVDGKAKSPLQVIRPGIQGYKINNLQTFLPVDEWLPKAKRKAHKKLIILAEQRQKRAEKLRNRLNEPVTYDELKEMCEAIGYIPSKSGDENTQKWLQIIYALKNEVFTENITEQEGYELFSIVSGPEANERQWTSMKPHGDASIGSIVYHAKESGYKRKHKYNYSQLETLETIPQEVIKVKGYLTPELLKDLIQRKEKLLIDSPTGSAKTTATMKAFKELANQNYHYYIFAAPTIPLTEQIAKDHDVICVTGGMTNLRNKIIDSGIGGKRIFVTTYDKAYEIIDHLSNGIDYGNDPEPEFTIVIDEIHKFTEAYNYRFKVIDQLETITKKCVSVIGLSGTPEDILKDPFDKLIKIDTGNNKSPCLDYFVFTYTTKQAAETLPRLKAKGIIEETETNGTLSDVLLIPVVKGLLKDTRVLLFINSKKRIKRVAATLRKQGIKTQIVTSDSKLSNTYKNIVENGKIDDSIQVVIATTVLADGISINNSLNWSCLVVADKESPIYNPSTIKQISNRFRGQYRYFGLYMREPNPDHKEDKPFYIESEYQYRKNIVTSYVEYLNTEFEGDQLQYFIPSNVERNNGIFYKSTDDEAKIEFNPLFIRHQSMKRKESYYSLFRNAFIKEVGKELGLDCKRVLNVNDEVLKHNADISDLLNDLEAEKEQEKNDDSKLRSNFPIYFDESVYQAFLTDDQEILTVFKGYVHPEQYTTVKRIFNIADYETCKKIGTSIKNRNETNKYLNDIKALVDIATFDHVKKTNVTKKAFQELSKIVGEKYLSSDFKEIIEKEIPKKIKVPLKDIKEALKLFHKISTKQGGKAYAQIEPLNIEIVAKARHEQPLKETAVKNSVLKYVWNQTAHNQKNMLPAIFEKWGIEKPEQ